MTEDEKPPHSCKRLSPKVIVPPPPPPPEGFVPMEGGYSLQNVMNKILKKPLSVVHEFENTKNGGKIAWKLFLMAMVSFSIFGFVVGMFSWGQQIWAAPVKIVSGIFFSGLICLPSLYIFSCIGGLDSKFVTILGMICLMMALAGFLLIGFAPVVWLFSASSESVTFIGGLLIVIWLISVGFCLSLLFRVGMALGMTNTAQLTIWSIIFVLVTLQMATTLRPVVGSDKEFFHFKEKKGFLTYWGEQLNEERFGIIPVEFEN